MKLGKIAISTLLILALSHSIAMANNTNLTGRINVTGQIVEGPCQISTTHTNLLLSCWVSVREIRQSVSMAVLRASHKIFSIPGKGVTVKYLDKRGATLLYAVNYN